VSGVDVRHTVEADHKAEIGKAVGTVKLTWGPMAKARGWKWEPGSPPPKLVLSNEVFKLFLDGGASSDLDLAKGMQLTVSPGPHTLQLRGWPFPEGLHAREYLPSDVVRFEIKPGETVVFMFESAATPAGQRRCVINHA
jgi:hypothetical protein